MTDPVAELAEETARLLVAGHSPRDAVNAAWQTLMHRNPPLPYHERLQRKAETQRRWRARAGGAQ
ncbi:MAG: hypothetical protein MOGMAGMI_02457 [Candidatus Omnitrophica bacterium]|nr:hypothetical protein [Candidatus Omnitrophota bacterium]